MIPKILKHRTLLSIKVILMIKMIQIPEIVLKNYNTHLYLCYLIDEIIRQETLNCAERGHVLVQIRDEIKTTIDAYQELNESVIANRIRRTLMASVKTHVIGTTDQHVT